MPLKVLSASAGSGKTFNLSMFYIKLAMEDADNFNKILAITFTNAAVNEMKNRILNRLFDLSKGIGIHEYREYAGINSNTPDDNITKQANEVLNRIVHNYFNFSVSTIDSFLQRLFKGALYEIGIRTNYELVVNNEEVIEQAINEFLLNLDEHQTVFKWLVKFIKNNAQENKASNYVKQLTHLTQEINKEFFYPFENEFALLSEQDFDKLESLLKNIMDNFINKAKNYQTQFAHLCQQANLTEDDFYQKKTGPASFLGSKLVSFVNEKGSIGKFDLTNTYLNEALNDGKWVSKSQETKFSSFKSSFQNLLEEFVQFIENEGKKYEDARIILEQLFNISILNIIVRNLHEYKKTNNIVLLSDIGKMLQGFINNNYLFIYEKLGVRYEYFLIDEFQDTSNIQYQVLKPLMENSISQKTSESVLLVGDIKQAIYRWRNGDWKLMNETIFNDFRTNINAQSLDYNWRSYPIVIDFNNALMKQLVSMTDLYKKNDKEDNSSLLALAQKIYKDVEQKFPEKRKLNDFKGYIKLKAQKSKAKNEDSSEFQTDIDDDNDDLKWVAVEVERLWEKGYKNIGIILRRNKEASLIFNYLMNNVKINDDDFKVISKESITYINSNAVMWVVFTLHYIQNSSLYANFMAKTFYNKLNNLTDAEEFFAKLSQNNEFKAKNLYFKAEYLINTLYQYFNEREKTFSIHFLQLLKKYLDNNSVSEATFLQWFFEDGINESIKISGEKKGVHLVTIHKSKGLEYDAVIVPFVNWTKKTGVDYLWFKKPEWIQDTTIPAFLVKSNKNLLSSNFKKEFTQEQNSVKMDDINLIYVAFTRAKKVLIAGIEQKLIGKEINKLIESCFGKEGLAQELKNFKTTEEDNAIVYEWGELQKNDEIYSDNESEYYEINKVSKPLTLNLVVKGNDELSSKKSIAYGVLIHAIMEQVVDICYWKSYAHKVLNNFNVSENEKHIIIRNIEQIFQKHPKIIEWYEKADKIISERKIFFNGKMYRPDKVFFHHNKVIFIDFKTGVSELEKYKPQVKRYKEMLRSMNYSEIESFLLNIDTNELVLVE